MKKTQPLKKTSNNVKPKQTKTKASVKKTATRRKSGTKSRKHTQKYGTSKLEMDFAHDFLDKLGLKYIYEYEAKDIGRFYDFAVPLYQEFNYEMTETNGIKHIKQESYNPKNGFMFFVETDGGFFHSDPRVVNEKKLNPMQKHNKFVDFVKDKWCDLHCIPLLRIWEEDIRKNPKLVFEQLNKYISVGNRKKRIDDNKKRPH